MVASENSSNYSTDFLNTSWSGEGADFGFYCQFYENSFSLIRLRKYCKAISQSFEFVDFYVANPPEDLRYQKIDLTALNSGKLKLDYAPPVIIAWLEDDAIANLRFFVRLYDFNIFQVGAASDYYYSGSRSEDRRRVSNIVDVLFLARETFGDAHTDFAASGWVERLVDEKISNEEPPNLTKHSETDWWVDEVIRKCEETRPPSSFTSPKSV